MFNYNAATHHEVAGEYVSDPYGQFDVSSMYLSDPKGQYNFGLNDPPLTQAPQPTHRRLNKTQGLQSEILNTLVFQSYLLQ